ncbi:MAG: histidine phosphatase family protein [Planctomycetota bacterium]|nr:MAG: histidine phosphatase family protein [Planctomycetota bacterium]
MAKARDLTLLLVRSCFTEWDDSGRLVGASDLPMCENGRAALEQALDELGPFDLDVVLCSPDESSAAAARILAGAANARVRELAGLSEVSLGLWEGLRQSDLAERYPTVYGQWVADPSSVQVPGGESFAQAEQRIIEGLRRGLEKTKARDTRIGVVVRPMAWAMIRCRLTSTPTRRLWEVLRDAPLADWFEIERGQLQGATDLIGVQS